MRIPVRRHTSISALAAVCIVLLAAGTGAAQAADTIIVSAEGLADPQAETYARDRALMIEDLRRDARRQVIEKAVGTQVSSSSLVENYALIEDRVFTQSKGLIKRVIKESPPWEGKDGFMHMLIKAEVYLTDIQSALKEMSRGERITLIKERGNPTISVGVMVRDAERGSDIEAEQSPIAENILKERFTDFGYRVWSEDVTTTIKQQMAERSVLSNQTETTLSITQMRAADFSVIGEAKFKSITHTLAESGITLTKYVLTSWTVKCVDNHTGQEIYFNNKVPRKRSWADEDQALEDIGRLMGAEFTKEFFDQHLSKPTRIFQMFAFGLPDYDMGLLLKKEFIGLRPVINVDLREFDAEGVSRFEVEFAGARGDFAQLINSTILRPLNRKCEERCFSLMSAHGDVVKVRFQSDQDPRAIREKFESLPPASLAAATPERVKALVQNEETMEKVARLNPDAVSRIASGGDARATRALDAVMDF